MEEDSRSAESRANEFYRKTLDSLISQIAILSEDGSIVAVNSAWTRFTRENGGEEQRCGTGANYLQACGGVKEDGMDAASRVVRGIRDVIAGRRTDFLHEYPCHSPEARRWFSVRITRFEISGDSRVVVCHENITSRRLAEARVKEANRRLKLAATTDGLTELPNRRSFDVALERETVRYQRDGWPLTLAMLDVDCFKKLNDLRGHLAGDESLRAVARAIKSRLRNPVELVARYGGEEFALILPRTDAEEAAGLLREILEAIRDLAIPNPHSTVALGVVTASIGCSTAASSWGISTDRLLRQADEALYLAKEQGRDRLVAWSPPVLSEGPRVPLVLRRAPA